MVECKSTKPWARALAQSQRKLAKEKNSHDVLLRRHTPNEASLSGFFPFSLGWKNSVSQKAHSSSKTSTNPTAFEHQNPSKANKQTRGTPCESGRGLALAAGSKWRPWVTLFSLEQDSASYLSQPLTFLFQP